MKLLFKGEKKKPAWVALFLLLVIFILFVLPEWVTLNRLIPSISQQFQESTGHPLSIGEIRFSFLTGPELRLRNITIGAEEGERPLAEAQEVRIGFQLLPLLWKRVEIVEIHLFAPTVSLTRSQQGEWNIEDLFQKKEGKGGWTVSIRSGIFAVRQGMLFFTDRALSEAPFQLTAHGIEMLVRRPLFKRQVDVQLHIPTVWQGPPLQNAAELKVDGRIETNGGFFGLKRETARFDVNLQRFDTDLIPYLPKAVLPFSFRAGRFTLEAQWADLFRAERLFRSTDTRIAGEAEQVTVLLSKGHPPVTIEKAAWRYNSQEGDFTLQKTHFLHSTFSKTNGSLHSPFSERQLDIETSGEVSLSDLAEVMHKQFGREHLARVKARGVVETAVKVKIPLKALSRTEFYGRLQVRDGEATPFSSFRPIQKIKGTVQLDGQKLLIESAEGVWGTGILTGTGKMPDLIKGGISFDLRATTLDWDAIHLPPGEELPEPSATTPSNARLPEPSRLSGSKEERDYAVGLIHIDHLKIKDYDFFQCESALIYREKTLQFRDTEANFEGGLFKANFAQIYFRPDDAVVLALTPDLRQINVGAFLKDFRGDGERPVMSGRALVAGGLNSQGKDFHDFKKNLSGKLVVYLEKGTIYRFKALARIFKLMNLRSLPDLNVKGIDYDALSGTLEIDRGKVILHDTILFGRDVRVIANGDIDLGKERYHLLMGVQVFRLVDEFLDQIPIAGPIFLGKDKMFIASYFEVKGELDDPQVQFKPWKTLKESTVAVLRRALTFPFRPKEFAG